MELIAIFLGVVIAFFLFAPKRSKPKSKELAPKLSEGDAAIEDLIWQQVGGAIARLSTTGKTHLIERIRNLPAREEKSKYE